MTTVADRWGPFDRRVRIERPVPDTSLDGAGSGTWALVREVWAGVKDLPPSRADRLGESMDATRRPARLRIRYREGVTPEMRFVRGARAMQIVAGPAELGRREALEFMVEDYRPAGSAA